RSAITFDVAAFGRRLFASRKEPFFEWAKPASNPHKHWVSADFRLQPQKPRFRTWVSGDLAEFSGRRKNACWPVFMRVRGSFAREFGLHLDLVSKNGLVFTQKNAISTGLRARQDIHSRGCIGHDFLH